jgi:GrpB-like predicted nucleotidyltransferase (UPF0157 family)
MLGLASDIVEVVPHDRNWPVQYARERDHICRALGSSVLDVQHVGSTAVPGLAAKPIIDIAVAIDSLQHAAVVLPVLESLEYELHAEIQIPGEIFFRKRGGTHHLHLLEEHSPYWENYLFFRDYLRKDAAGARRYLSLKKRLADRFARDRNSYTRGKARFIESVLQKAATR